MKRPLSSLKPAPTASEKGGRESDKFVIPSDVLSRDLNSKATSGAAGPTGGYTIATSLLAESFIDILRNQATILQWVNGKILVRRSLIDIFPSLPTEKTEVEKIRSLRSLFKNTNKTLKLCTSV